MLRIVISQFIFALSVFDSVIRRWQDKNHTLIHQRPIFL